MSVQQNQDVTPVEIDDKAVADYLLDNPGFFNERDELLAQMAVVHTTGASVSLIERQVAILREQNGTYQQQLAELIEVARINDTLMLKMQKLVLALLESSDLQEILALIEQSLRDDFNADGVTLCLFTDPDAVALDSEQLSGLRVMFTARDDEKCSELSEMFEGDEPACGVLGETQLGYLFDKRGGEIRSVAQLPLVMTDKVTGKSAQPLGVLAIGSEDAGRFCAGVGTVFLKYLGALVTRKLRPFLVAEEGAAAVQ